jgi:hypothetical protein
MSMNNTVKIFAVCVAAPVVALGVAAPTAWAKTGTGHSHHNGDPFVDHQNDGPVVNRIFVLQPSFVPPAEHHPPNLGID